VPAGHVIVPAGSAVDPAITVVAEFADPVWIVLSWSSSAFIRPSTLLEGCVSGVWPTAVSMENVDTIEPRATNTKGARRAMITIFLISSLPYVDF
jgi:hypothetical protein